LRWIRAANEGQAKSRGADRRNPVLFGGIAAKLARVVERKKAKKREREVLT